ncbi:MAG: benzylsuccinate synthase beta subunit family protein [Desulfobacterales bacterium]|jgi:benzylsuccinate synthase|nr:benzylsuccinate synthase beta subunit family protein [Desulfobacterales bacterium]
MEFPKSPISMLNEPGTNKPCKTCRWSTSDVTNPIQGRCTVNRAASGAVWVRLIPNINETTCAKYEKGTLSFRDNI